MSLPRSFVLERIGGRRRMAVEAGGTALCLCAYLGPRDAAVDLVEPEGTVAARIRGGTMAVRTFHATLSSGEGLRLHGSPPRLAVESDRRAPTEVSVAEEPDGWRALTWLRDAGIAGVLRTKPLDGAVAWTLDVPGWEEPLRALAVLHAAERLIREAEEADTS